MSKIRPLLILPLVLLLYFLLPNTTFATSGCCSYHGGVNCSAGAQYNGRVICNDGWTGSSCYYSEMVMCGGGYSTTPNCPLNSSYNSLSGNCECYSGYIAQGGSCVSANSYCWNNYGYNSRYNSLYQSCECSYGYVFNSSGTKCISEDEACKEQYGYGAKATISGDKCECNYGYKWEGSRCVLDLSSDDDSYSYKYIYPTSRPTNTPTPRSTLTPRPTSTPTPIPTKTPIPTNTSTVLLNTTDVPTPEVKGESAEEESSSSLPILATGFIGWIFYKYRHVLKERIRGN